MQAETDARQAHNPPAEASHVTPATAGSSAGAHGRAVLLGVGNILLSDEGVGVRLVERLMVGHRMPTGLQVLDGGTCAMEMLEDLEHLDLLVIADCVRSGRSPGSVVVLRDDEVPTFFRTKLSPHQVGLADVLATLQFVGRAPRRTVVVGVEPQSLATGMTLSAPVRAALAEAEAELLDALAGSGYGLEALREAA